MGSELRRGRGALLGLGLFLIVWGGKLWTIDRWGTDLPWWDDWSGIGAKLLVPFERGELGVGEFFAPHNEHRILWTRLLDLALYALNGQWDARLECVASAAAHAAIVVFAFFAGARVLSAWRRLAWFIALIALTALPVVWENVVRGFDSQHYFLIGFSLATLIALTTGRAGSRCWWLGVAAAVAALFTMGSGLLAVLVVAVTLIATTARREVWARHRWTLAACVAVFLAGWLLRHHVPAHDPHRAQNLQEFAIAFWHHLQWPLVHHAWFGAVSWLPWIALTWRCVRPGSACVASERVVVALGLWALTHFVAMAWMRGHMQPWPPTRGLENVVVGLAVNFLALLLAHQRSAESGATWKLRWLGPATGVVIASYGLVSIIHENVSLVLPGVARHARLVERNTRAFLATGDRAWLKPGEIPFPSVDSYASVLGVPEIQASLPLSVRLPRVLDGTASPSTSFVTGGAPAELPHPALLPVVGSYGADGVSAEGEWRSVAWTPTGAAYWQFDVAGSLAASGVDIELVAADGSRVSQLPEQGISAAVWSSILVSAPDGPAQLVARDQSDVAWLAFSGPIEAARGSILARRICGVGWWLAIVGVALSLWSWTRGRSRPAANV